MAKNKILNVKSAEIKTLSINSLDYISTTDIAKQRNPTEPKDVVKNWMRLKNTLEYLGLWEKLNNPNFKGVEFNEAGNNAFTMNELICLSNMENLNAVFIQENRTQQERLIKLNRIAIQQMTILEDVEKRNLLK
ncbi:MAG: KilA-N domain-containing protein [Vicingaceae bacterium]|nr:KilA-N domain-containing protein [Vicingaceae bacterium]